MLKTADDLVTSRSGKPRQSNLRRAASTAYYALFHCLAKCAADLLVGGKSATRSEEAWIQVYRALEHGAAKTACKNQGIIKKFPREIEDFANAFVTMQTKRHKADYDPSETLYKSSVIQDIANVRGVISGFQGVSVKDRRAFAAYVLFKTRA